MSNNWTHRYSYKLETTRYIDRAGYIHTGTIQVGREFADHEVEALAKLMHHGRLDDATLIECTLIETRA